ncbi:hypothetical protein EJ02DRAFT_421029 [Clathrospora elynae]|uniref:Uncharacterized protein n=1 Tax=Clathrospora elynae TaxID=706981 RepID=A0A6A5SV96_9PLEO|nr:hypothetical protein EJ02DRAFT_421029 [Clathrospora elynae]
MCISAEIPKTIGSRAQEDFLVACRTIDPEYGIPGLRALIDLEEADTAIPLVDDFISNSIAAELDAAYTNVIGQRKLDAALTANNGLRDRINRALGTWRTKHQGGGKGSIDMDDGNPPTRPTANTAHYMAQDLEQFSPDEDTTHDDQVEAKTKMLHDD